MSALWTIFIFVLILSFVTFIHEIGHFATAKWRGVKVLEFGMGFPPRIWGFRRGETEYSLNAIPFGGFTKMLGEEDPSEPRSLASKGVSTRILILSAGSLMMFLFPVILFTIVYMVPHDVVVGGEGIRIVQVVTDTPAHTAGIEPDDEILSIDGELVNTIDELRDAVNPKLGTEITMELQRGSETFSLKVVPREEWPEGQGPLGIGIAYATTITEKESYPPWSAVYRAGERSWQMVVVTKDAVVELFRGKGSSENIGIIPVIQETGRLAESGILYVLDWVAYISIFLGIANLLPIPALDGGRIAFVLLEVMRRGKRIAPQKEGLIHLVAFVLLNALCVLVILYFDIPRLSEWDSLFP